MMELVFLSPSIFTSPTVIGPGISAPGALGGCIPGTPLTTPVGIPSDNCFSVVATSSALVFFSG